MHARRRATAPAPAASPLLLLLSRTSAIALCSILLSSAATYDSKVIVCALIVSTISDRIHLAQQACSPMCRNPAESLTTMYGLCSGDTESLLNTKNNAAVLDVI
jgi:hypothetical protein